MCIVLLVQQLQIPVSNYRIQEGLTEPVSPTCDKLQSRLIKFFPLGLWVSEAKMERTLKIISVKVFSPKSFVFYEIKSLTIS